MTEKQTKTLQYAGFTEAQIAALASVFPAFPPPERRKEIDGFVRETVERMNDINEGTRKKAKSAWELLKFKIDNMERMKRLRDDDRNPNNQ